MSRRSAAESRQHLVAALRWASSLSWLILVVALFFQPLSQVLGRLAQAVGGNDLFGPAVAAGFMMEVDSLPGSRVLVNGVERGTVPAVISVDCTEGEGVTIRVAKEGFEVWERTVRCREGKRLTIQAPLRRMKGR